MTRRQLFFAITGSCMIVWAWTVLAFAQAPQEVQINVTELGENLHMLQDSGGMGNSVALTGEDGALLIDTKVSASVDPLLAEVEKLGGRPLRFAILTHWHFDHTGGNQEVAKTGAVIIAHENVRRQMSIPHDMKLLNNKVPASPEAALPKMTFAREIVFHMNGETVKVFHLAPGHTDGDAVVHFRKANVMQMGDLYFEGLYPYIGIYSGGSINGMIEVIQQLLPMMDEHTKVVPGHGPLSNKARLQAYVAMLTTIRDNVAGLIREGKSLEAAVAAKPTRAFDEKWGKGFLPPDRFAKLVYMDLSPDLP